MPAFPRVITPVDVSPLQSPSPVLDITQAGRGTARNFTQAGWVWTEVYPPLNRRTPEVQAFLATIDYFWNQGIEFTIDHGASPGSGFPVFGSAAATVRVVGGGQTGDTISTDGWPTSTTNVVRVGEILTFAGISRGFRIVEDTDSNGSGVASIKINPPVFVGGSPGDNALIARSNVMLTARIVENPRISDISRLGAWVIGGFKLTFRETLS